MSVFELMCLIEWLVIVGMAILMVKILSRKSHAVKVAEDMAMWRDCVPEYCPVTGLPFFMAIEHPDYGCWFATYGGPYDSYTIPIRDKKTGEFERMRFDHDEGY